MNHFRPGFPLALVAMLLVFSGGAARGDSTGDLSWLAGHWVTADGAAEEVWLEPRGGAMSGSFRWVMADGRQVLEYLVIEDSGEGVVLRFKHYGTDFVPWEKDGPNEYRLEKREGARAEFILSEDRPSAPRRIVYERDGDRLRFLGVGDEGEDPLRLEFRRR